MRPIDADALYLGKFVEPPTEWHQGWNDALDAATTQAPTIEAVPVVHGRWEIKWNAGFVDPFGETEEIPSAVCPFCGHEEFYVAYDDDWAKPHNYCPNCGAKMDGE